MNPMESRFERWYNEAVAPSVKEHPDYPEYFFKEMLRVAFRVGGEAVLDRLTLHAMNLSVLEKHQGNPVTEGKI
jgi:hypothetical protein